MKHGAACQGHLSERRHATPRWGSAGPPRTLAAVLVVAATVVFVLQGGSHWSPLRNELRLMGPLNGTQRGDPARDHLPPHTPEMRALALPSPLPPLLLSALGLPRNRSVGHAPGSYITKPTLGELAEQRQQLQAYLSGQDFKAAQKQRLKGPRRGIIINAGGSLLVDAVVLLRVLRRVVNCTLPVELVWHGAAEMDDDTLASLKEDFGPIRGYDLTAVAYPDHHRQGIAPQRYMAKAMSIMLSQFQQVLLLDSDNIPLINPESLFDQIDLKMHGNVFWPDFLRGAHASEKLLPAAGLDPANASEVLRVAKGDLPERETESGQLMLDLNRHADVAQYAFLLNTFEEELASLGAWGDKDLFALAFAQAGKAHLFSAVQVPPGLAFAWEARSVARRGAVKDGYRCSGLLQFDHTGRTAFIHRNWGKYAKHKRMLPVDVMTGPLPWRWLHYYAHPRPLGPFRGVPEAHVYSAPPEAFHLWGVNPPQKVVVAMASEHRWRQRDDEQACPVATFLDYWHMRELGLPVGANATLDAACRGVLQRLLGAREFERRDALGFIATPELVNLVQQHPFEQVAHVGGEEDQGGGAEVPDPTPVPAWRVGAETLEASVVDTDTLRALRLMHATPDWLRENSARFPGVTL